MFGPGEAGCFRQVAALYSDHYRQVPLYMYGTHTPAGRMLKHKPLTDTNGSWPSADLLLSQWKARTMLELDGMEECQMKQQMHIVNTPHRSLGSSGP